MVERDSVEGAAVEVEETEGVLTITLNRPEVRNALVPDLEAGLIDAIGRAAAPSVRAVVLTGAGPTFCAGANMKELDGHNDDRDEAALHPRARELPDRVVLPLWALEKPVIAALNGPAVGAGIGLALAADFRIGVSSASFVFAFHRVALAPDLGTCWALPRIVGDRVARDLLLRGRALPAGDALECGLLDHVAADDELRTVAHAWAEELAQGPTLALAKTKYLLRRAETLDLESFLEEEVLAQSVLVRSDDHHEGVAAFTDRRPPSFTGR